MIKPATPVGSEPILDPSIIPAKTRVSKRRSRYRELLQRLLDSPKNSALRVKNVGARYAFAEQARALGYEAVFAEHDGWLYVKIGALVNQKRQSGGRRAD